MTDTSAALALAGMWNGRSRLANRRENHIETLSVAGQTFTACIGFDPETGRPREVFLNGGKEGSQFDAMLADAATAISIALQYGVPPSALTKSIGRVPRTISPGEIDDAADKLPASAIGAALDLVSSFEPEPS